VRRMVLRAYGEPLEMDSAPVPIPGPGEALVEVLACGLCFSDIKTIRGRMPYSADLALPHVPGHEISGRVVELNGAAGPAPGTRVVVFHNWGCQQCAACRSGLDNICRTPRAWVGFTHQGGFQEYLTVPAEYLLVVPDELSPVDACPLTCAIGTAYRAVVVRGRARPGERVVVLGLGGVGIHAAQIAQLSGTDTLGIDLDQAKVDAARSVGVRSAGLIGDLERLVHEQTAGSGADLVVETTGVPDLVEAARRVSRAGSRIVTVGYRVGEQIAVQSDGFTLWEHELLGSRYGTRADIAAGIQLVSDGLLRPVVSQVFALEEANEAVRRLEQGNVTGRLVLSVRPEAGASS
jgi:D-arabinose 1-dehydrogenase-like Zn-dependent alcohol dehydrogenase